MLRFAGFELDTRRAELRGPDGGAIRLRPKSFDLLLLLAANPGRVLRKDELMAAVWPNVHVSEDSLFQCVREIRAALGNEQRQLLKVISGRGYLFDVEVSGSSAPDLVHAPAGGTAAPSEGGGNAAARGLRAMPGRRRLALAAVSALAIACLAIAWPAFWSGYASKPPAPTFAVMLIADAGDDPLSSRMAANVTASLVDGLATIDTIRVVTPPSAANTADYLVTGELQKSDEAWTVLARMTERATTEVKWSASLSVDIAASPDPKIQQSRLAAGLGHSLALEINSQPSENGRAASDSRSAATGRIVIQQATAYINQTSPERFRAAQQMLESALAADPGNVDLQVALAVHLLRGVQMVWYKPEQSRSATGQARLILEKALNAKPTSVAVHEAYCRFLTTTNQFPDSLVACARTLTFDPWNGIALYHIGLSQLYLGRFEDALETFRQADRYDTPQVARWTWTLGAGWACMLMGRAEQALPWLQRSIEVTPASGRTHFLLAAAYQQLGRLEEAKAATAKGLELRPGSNARNVRVPTDNASPVFLAAVDRLIELGIAAGLPQR